MENRLEELVDIFKEIGVVTGYGNITKFINGNFSRKKSGNLLMTIELPKEVVREECNGIPLDNDDYDFVPLIVFVKKIR